MERISPENGLAQAEAIDLRGLRYSAVRWRDVEPVRTEPPTYRWDALADLEQQLLSAARSGMVVSLVIQATPDWAQHWPGYICGPIAPDRLDEFSQFLTALVSRYRHPPYNIAYWELFNEPDVDPALVEPNSVYGCWGDQDDPYYGGEMYARMLRFAYPAIKAVDPQAQVILGGLLLDAPYGPPSTYLEGILRAGGGQYYDILAFHSYAFYHPELYNWQTLPNTKWVEWGGVMTGKVKFLRQTLAEAGLVKPLILNEAGLAWWAETEPPDDYREGQADYVVKLYTRGIDLDLAGVTWYGWRAPEWRYMELLNEDLSPTPAYRALGYLISRLRDARYLGPTAHAGLEGYRFQRGGVRLEVLWSADGETHPVAVPAGEFVAVFDLFGQPASYDSFPGGVTIPIRRPAYVERRP